MTKKAAMPIYGKNLQKISSSEPKRISLKLGIQHWALKHFMYQVCSNDDPRLKFDQFCTKVNFGFLYFCIGNA